MQYKYHMKCQGLLLSLFRLKVPNASRSGLFIRKAFAMPSTLFLKTYEEY